MLPIVNAGGLESGPPAAEQGGAEARFDSEFCEEIFAVFFDGARTDAEEHGDVGIGFAFADPGEDFGFAAGEAGMLCL